MSYPKAVPHQTSHEVGLCTVPASHPHESRVAVTTDVHSDEHPEEGTSFADEPREGASGVEHAIRLPRLGAGSQGFDSSNPNSIEYSLRELESGLSECTWKDEFGGDCGFVSQVNYVKKHTRRVHLRLRSDFSNILVLRSLTNHIYADLISVRSAAMGSLPSICAPFTKTFSECERSFRPILFV